MIAALLFIRLAVVSVGADADPWAAAQQALKETRINDAIRHGQRAAAEAPAARERLEFLAGIYDAFQMEAEARENAKALKGLPPAADQPPLPPLQLGEPPPPTGPAYVTAPAALVRQAASSNATVLRTLPINSQVTIQKSAKGFASIGGGGFVSTTVLAAEPLSQDALRKDADALLAQGKKEEALRLLARVIRLRGRDQAALRLTLELASDLHQYRLAADAAAMVLHDKGALRVRLTLLRGCWGPPGKRRLVSAKDALQGPRTSGCVSERDFLDSQPPPLPGPTDRCAPESDWVESTCSPEEAEKAAKEYEQEQKAFAPTLAAWEKVCAAWSERARLLENDFTQSGGLYLEAEPGEDMIPWFVVCWHRACEMGNDSFDTRDPVLVAEIPAARTARVVRVLEEPYAGGHLIAHQCLALQGRSAQAVLRRVVQEQQTQAFSADCPQTYDDCDDTWCGPE